MVRKTSSFTEGIRIAMRTIGRGVKGTERKGRWRNDSTDRMAFRPGPMARNRKTSLKHCMGEEGRIVVTSGRGIHILNMDRELRVH